MPDATQRLDDYADGIVLSAEYLSGMLRLGQSESFRARTARLQAALRRAQQQIETAGKTVEGIITTRTNVMERKLKDIDALEDADQADEILGLTPAGLSTDQEDED